MSLKCKRLFLLTAAALHCPPVVEVVWSKRWNFSSSARTTIRHRDGWKLEETRAFVALLPVGTGDTPSIDWEGFQTQYYI